jgi:penicillin V acylase-like amidase (Ntn superfamily)
MCTSFCINNGDHCVFGTNMDHDTLQLGQVFVNKRHVLKTAWEPSTSGEYARWISEYGSVTLNAVGSQLPWGGMNEAGLMISTMSLVETEEPAPDERPPLAAPFWMQYQLDNSSSIEEVIESEAHVRITDAFDHYLVCDRTGDCAVIEFLGGEMVVYTSSSLPAPALTNSTYQDSLMALEDGNYWRLEVFGVSPDGPAAEAGILEGDWITAIDGVELASEQSLETFHSVIGQREPGDEVTLTVRHPGLEDPLPLTLTMAPLPEDMSRYVLPPGVPEQILSLGFLPKGQGDFLVRFATAAEWADAFVPAGSEEAVAYAFDGLEDVSRDDTVWSAVFDPANLHVHFHTNRNPQIRSIEFSQLDLSCETPALMLDVHAEGSGDISGELMEYSREMALDHGIAVATNMWQMDVSALYVETILGGFESFPCMEDNFAALEAPTQYVENHPVLLPPAVTWAALMVVHRLWPVWVLLTLLSLGIVIWQLVRGPEIIRGSWAVWILVVVLLGPLGLLVYWLSKRSKYGRIRGDLGPQNDPRL